MGDKKFTFIELHLDGETQFGPRSIPDALPFGEPDALAGDDLEAETDEEEATAEDDGGAGKAIGAVVALAFLVALGVAVKKYRGDDEEDELEREEQPDVIVN
ncbi:hypothetical protein [Natrarchaeobaculum sulfurireducens]|uniref:Uncharacterized protein n=1 Tax=Natrarchaeobaculum sulfurireducens TaxID=2044521 RepID=A0A346PBJ0_9EURY|nr:hypothetical protein [Natrarchaeobaculum sulfurireducens]AXR76885.1 hypothetical protein AArc1_0541 [Natrarchaeobaculum sulfurireducens]